MKQIFLLIFILPCYSLFSQNLLDSKHSSHIYKVFQLSSEQAESFYLNPDFSSDETAYKLVYTDTVLPNDLVHLPYGHYLISWVYENEHLVRMETISNSRLLQMKNGRDLMFTLNDMDGNLIKNAAVQLGKKHIRFDEDRQSYIKKNRGKDKIIRVNHEGVISYFSLNWTNNRFKPYSVPLKLFYLPPLKYVWMPFRDGYKSIKRHNEYGMISDVADWFRPYDERYNDSGKFKGYMVTNKPMFMPGDTLFFKAFITRKKGKPLKKKLAFELYQTSYQSGSYTHIGNQIQQLRPYRAGAYQGYFILSDTIGFQLNRDLHLDAKAKEEKTLKSIWLGYEEYELDETSYSISLDKKTHSRGDTNHITLVGKDSNGRFLRDANATIHVLTNSIESSEKTQFIPDTLWTYRKSLEIDKETVINIPDSIFPNAGIAYMASVTFLNSAFEKHVEEEYAEFIPVKWDLDFVPVKDSLEIKLLKNGIHTSEVARIQIFSGESNPIDVSLELPAKLKISPFNNQIQVRTSKINESYVIKDDFSRLTCNCVKTNDSIYISINNPNEIEFTYELFRGKHRIESGKGRSYDRITKAGSKSRYYVKLSYVWGGTAYEETFNLVFFESRLNIIALHKSVAFPGMVDTLRVLVKDSKGKPLRNTDLTATALTSKFNNTNYYRGSPEMPYFGKIYKGYFSKSLYSMKSYLRGERSYELNYHRWSKSYGLDSMVYYDFLYPGNQVFSHVIPSTDSITQFAPFVIERGSIDPVMIIYLDDKPVYFRSADQSNSYSFATEPGPHKLELRTRTKSILIKSFSFQKGVKTILSVDAEYPSADVLIDNENSQLDEYEKKRLSRYMLFYVPGQGNSKGYFQQNSKFFLPNRGSGEKMIGPVSSGMIKFNNLDLWSTDFLFEDGYTYSIEQNRIKLKEKRSYYYDFSWYGPKDSFHDQVITRKTIEELWKKALNTARLKKNNYSNPNATLPGRGTLAVVNDSLIHQAKNTLVVSDSLPFGVRVYPGGVSIFHDLKEGTYHLYILLPNDDYVHTDSVYVKKNGTTTFKMNRITPERIDDFSIFLDQLIEDIMVHSKVYLKSEKNQKYQQIYDKINQSYKGSKTSLFGKITDIFGNGLPGVNIIVQGTTRGTVSDMNGNYSIRINDRESIEISFIGYRSRIIENAYPGLFNLTLFEMNEILEEVVVTAFGIEREKKSLGYAVTTISGGDVYDEEMLRSLQGRVPGVNITSASGVPGSSSRILIRGNNSPVANSQPLMVIDGIPYSSGSHGIIEFDTVDIKSISILKGAEASALYGARGSNGVIIISTKSGILSPSRQKSSRESIDDFSIRDQSSIRNYFSDYAFWKPSLKTDENGIAEFVVKYPDDITSWDFSVLAMGPKKQTGTYTANVRSIKNLSAQLSMPRFLVEGDKSDIIGKTLNYNSTSTSINTSFKVNNVTVSDSSFTLKTSGSEMYTLSGKAGDSLQVTYELLQNKDGYFDGERRSVSVYPLGTMETSGSFLVLQGDTTLILVPDQEQELSIDANVTGVLEEEIGHVLRYRYSCNEQLASKLKVLCVKQRIVENRGERFRQGKEIKKIIRNLEENYQEGQAWGWWPGMKRSNWISLHVISALMNASQLGYETRITDYDLIEELKYLELFDDSRLHASYLLANSGESINHVELGKWFAGSKPDIQDTLVYFTTLDRLGLPVDTDLIKLSRKTTLFGNYYWGNTSFNLRRNSIQSTLWAYRLLHNKLSETEKSKIINYLLEERASGHWRNTFESAQIIEILTEEDSTSGSDKALIVNVNAEEIDEFPHEKKISEEDTIIISKSGRAALYISMYSKKLNSSPAKVDSIFEIKTHFIHNFDTLDQSLVQGSTIRYLVEVEVKKDMEYAFLNIPIPAGCSYAEQRQYRNESYREYDIEATRIFLEKLKAGKHRFEIKLNPRYTGSYHVNPVRLEQMYFPVFYGRNEIKEVSITQTNPRTTP